MLIAITREVSASLAQCELTWLDRRPIDIEKARAEHRAYEHCLRDLGARVISLPALDEYPDAVFVEDPAIVLDEVAVITTMGASSRRGERESLAVAVGHYKPVIRMSDPARLEGGDVMRAGRQLYAGLSGRTDAAGIAQLGELLAPYGYRVHGVPLHGCLHLKSACCALSDDTVLLNREWVDASLFGGHRLIDVAPGEPGAANALAIGNTVVMPDVYPATAEILRREGFAVRALDMTELMKAESGVTCSSLLFEFRC
ncbi:MAG TPA: arginine deiminase family protein [Bryobacteraceae bacterium]|nr:arginine deiminase family protein [Bryobacteraceae bacterium]